MQQNPNKRLCKITFIWFCLFIYKLFLGEQGMKIEKILNKQCLYFYWQKWRRNSSYGKRNCLGKKQGNEVELSRGYKIFSNSDKELNQRLKNIVSDIPEEYMEITEQVVCMLEKEYDKKVNDII